MIIDLLKGKLMISKKNYLWLEWFY